jgi:hypothetical protein
MHFRLPPHPAHAGGDIDAHALSSSARGSAGRNRRPTCLVEWTEEAIWDEAASRCIDVATAVGILALGVCAVTA